MQADNNPAHKMEARFTAHKVLRVPQMKRDPNRNFDKFTIFRFTDSSR
jgi:hypothetical protein